MTYPAHWTVRDARDAYLSENGFTLGSYDEPTTDVTLGPFTLRFPNTPKHRRALMRHDLHHVATGYGTDFVGEYEISVWEIRLGLAGIGRYVSAIVASGALGGVLFAPRRARAAWRAAERSRGNLFGDRFGYEELLSMTVGELREALGLPRGGLTDGHGVHAHAPKREERASDTQPRPA